MSSVGLNFGSATSGQGFDVASTVSSILAIQQGVEAPWKNSLTALQSQDTVLSSLGTDLSSLSTAVGSLTDFQGVLAQKEGSSSDTNTVALTAASATAAAGTHSVTVSQLAQTSSVYTDVLGASDTLSGSLTIQVGSGSARTVTVDSSSDTVSSLAAAINAAAIGVTASVIQDSNGSRLSLVSRTGGSAGQLTVTSALNDVTTNRSVATQPGTTGQDAQLTVDGVAITSGTNTLTTAIPGVTFQLLNTSSAAVQVVITNNNSAVSSAVSSVVSAYNQVVKDLKTQEGKDPSGKAEPLFGSPILSQVQTALSQALFGGAASGSVSNITQLGVTVNADGTLAYSDSTFQGLLNTNFKDVVGFLQDAGSFGQNFASVLDGLGTNNVNGAVYLQQQENSAQESALNTDVTNEETLIANEKTTLTAELMKANQTLQEIPAQLNEVNEIYSAVTGYNKNSQ